MGQLLKPEDKRLIQQMEEVRDALTRQLEKDLGAELRPVSPGAFWEDTIASVWEYLEGRFGLSDADLPQLLYTIDVDQSDLQRDMASGRWDSWYALLAERIVEREATKVLLRLRLAGRI